ncbi:tyrosine-type recombinase/integrase [Sedimentibacter sp. zth1]|uniref:tyrosine-type recombinase/integrase n=1 Tax=Sedimentibacter sp. zth1 TaxID=2816908 RepID=UPI001A912D33|nr:tyrosine-type recombinase/integrase [Sedimentibacter sp. zth1]
MVLLQDLAFHNSPLSRQRVYDILNKVADTLNISKIGTHTLRKTFGYHFYQQTKDVAILQEIFNHSSPNITRRYIGIDQDVMDKAIGEFRYK